tara:strand:- start:1227 stop:1868 length:642 start_codon:yes stop_codon:yes gene_type:complete
MKNKIIHGQVIPFNQSNIDTDAIIPKQYLKSIKKSGFGPFLFDSLRYLDPGDLSTKAKRKINPEFILNKDPYSSGNIILANDNFGCGSSREHAVWAIKDYGIDVVISTSFADIFKRNSFKNSLLLISISKNILDKLFQEILDSPNYELTIDVQNQTITTPSKQDYDFDISDSDKERIIEGYDDIGLSLMHKNKIEQYEKKMKQKKPWMFGKQS